METPKIIPKTEFIQLIEPIKIGEYHKGREITNAFYDEIYENYRNSKQTFNDWLDKFISNCWDCCQDCSRCTLPLFP